jgi:hypothetical protein
VSIEMNSVRSSGDTSEGVWTTKTRERILTET